MQEHTYTITYRHTDRQTYMQTCTRAYTSGSAARGNLEPEALKACVVNRLITTIV